MSTTTPNKSTEKPENAKAEAEKTVNENNSQDAEPELQGSSIHFVLK